MNTDRQKELNEKLWKALAYNSPTAEVKSLLEMGADLHYRNVHERTLLHVAATSANKDTVKLLLDKGLDKYINSKDHTGDTPLHIAAVNSHAEIANILIEAGADIHAINSSGHNILHSAAMSGDGSDTLRLFLTHKMDAELNAEDQDGNTPLHFTCYTTIEKYEQARILLEAGANVNARNHKQETPLILAAHAFRNNYDLIRLLVEHGADICAEDSAGLTPLDHAHQEQNAENIQALLDVGADLHAVNQDQQNVLHTIAKQYSPISYALEDQEDKIIRLLQKNDLSKELNAVDIHGDTPLHCACRARRPKLVQLFIDAGAYIHRVNNEQQTLLHVAVDCPDEKFKELRWNADQETANILNILLNLGMTEELNAKDAHGNTPLYHAYKLGEKEAVKQLLSAGANPGIANENGLTLFHAVAHVADTEMMQFLHGRFLTQPEQSKQLVNVANEWGATPLHIACHSRAGAIADMLLEKGADINAKDQQGMTPLMVAASAGATDLLYMLLERNAQMDIADNDGRTALMYAVVHSEDMCVSLLLEYGADVNRKDKMGATALDWAEQEPSTNDPDSPLGRAHTRVVHLRHAAIRHMLHVWCNSDNHS